IQSNEIYAKCQARIDLIDAACRNGLRWTLRYPSRRLLLSSFMQRRDFLKTIGLAAANNRLVAQQPMQMQPQSFLTPTVSEDVAKTDFTLEIAPIAVELAPNRIISTIGYNGI